MNLTCDNGRMPWPCQLAWGIAIIACIAGIALVLTCFNGTAGADSVAYPAPAKETYHAQP